MTTSAAIAVEKIRQWRAEPHVYIYDVLKRDCDRWQRQACDIFAVDPRLIFQSCVGPGKTFMLAGLSTNFMVTRGGDGFDKLPRVICASFNAENLENNLWTELSMQVQGSPILNAQFQFTQSRIYQRQYPKNWYIDAVTWPKTADANQQAASLKGYHGENLMFTLDEIGAMPPAVIATSMGIFATHGGTTQRLVAAGNPLSNTGALADIVYNQADEFKIISITADPDDPDRTPRVSVEHARRMIALHGRDNPWVLVDIFGKFPPQAINSLLSPSDVFDSIRRSANPGWTPYASRRIGIDVAREGLDATVWACRAGLDARYPLIEKRSQDTGELLTTSLKLIDEFKPEYVFIDVTGGYGLGLLDALQSGTGCGCTVIEVNFSANASDPNHYSNKRAEMWWQLAQWVKRGGCLPNDNALPKELSSVTYTYDGKNRLLLESKELIKLRIGRSPDKGDALAVTFALPEAYVTTVDPIEALKQQMGFTGNNQAGGEYRPFEE